MLVIKNSSGFQETQIIIQTRKGRDIENSQTNMFSASEIITIESLKNQYKGPGIEFRTGPISIYNCHGLTFASRRSCIYNSHIVTSILEDDCYVEVEKKNILPGDVILYLDQQNGEIIHSGIVVSEPDKYTGALMIVSKWGRAFEVIHWAHICPYSEYYPNAKYYRVTK